MTFNKCSINGKCYGDIIDDKTGEPIDVDEVKKNSHVMTRLLKSLNLKVPILYILAVKIYILAVKICICKV